MKRFLLPLIALMLSVSITNAQSGVKLNTKKAPIGTLQKNGNAMPAVPGMNKQKAATAPAKIQLAENQKIMGPYTTDELGQYGMGLTNKPGNLPIAAILDASNIKKFNGGKVTAIRFGLCQTAKVNKVFIKAVKNGNFEDLFEQEFTGNTVVGWNTVTIENPYTLDLNGVDALLLGFEYVQARQGNIYPLSFAGKETATAAYTDFGEGLDWYTIGGAGGSLSVQAIVEKEYPAADIVVNDVYSMEFVKPGDKIQYGFSYYNDGTAPISVYSFGIAIDGNEVAVIEAPTKDLTTTAKNYSGMLEAQNLPVGYHTLSVYVKQMNNETPADASNSDTKLGVYTESLQRQKHLLEHFTSQYCAYCPAGINLLEYLNKQRDDLAWVSLHGNMNGGVDMFTIPEGTDIMGLMTGGFPSAAFDRFPLGDGDIAIGIGVQDAYIPTYANEISRTLDQIGQQYPVFATVDITAKVNETTGNLDIKVSGETTKEFAALMGNEAAITVYVTEDSIVARQLNNGIWKSKYTHNSVLRKVVTDAYGTKLNVEGNKYENNYNVTLPDGWNKKNLNAVAFIGNAITDENLANGNIWVTNANCVKADYSTTGISTPTASAENRPVEYYTLDGIRIETPAKGLNIVKLSNGEVRKVMIK